MAYSLGFTFSINNITIEEWWDAAVISPFLMGFGKYDVGLSMFVQS